MGSMKARRLPFPAATALALSGLPLAALVGYLTAVRPQMAIGITVAFVAVAIVVIRTIAILGLLIVSVFLEIVTVGGVTISRLIAPIALLATVAALGRGNARIAAAAPLGWAGAYCCWALASGLWTLDTAYTATKLASLAIALIYMFSFASLIGSVRDLRNVLTALAVGGLLIGLYAIGTFLSGSVERAEAGTGDPNFFATYQIVALPIVLVLAGNARASWARVGLGFTAIVLIGSVFATLSRGGILTLVAVLLLLLVVPARTVFRSGGHKLAVLVVLLVGAGFLFQASSDVLLPRIQTIVTSDRTGAGRTNEWMAVRTTVGERPVLGLGYGGFVPMSNQLMKRTPGVDLRNFDLRPEGSEAHNAYLSTLAELGVIGLVIFVLMLASTARLLLRLGREARSQGSALLAKISTALLLGLLAWAVASFFLSSETSRPIWILIGLSLAVNKLVRQERDSPAQGAPPDGA